jgi:beta-glucosidase-like glycosyl hydrolase
MNISEKIPSLNTNAPDIKSLGLNGYNWWEEASTGVSNGHATTKFAFPITIGMSFNRTLWQLTGRQIGHEARALMNAGLAGSTYWAPVVNLAREPRWGRNIEGDITHISIPRSFITKIDRGTVCTGAYRFGCGSSWRRPLSFR